MLLAWHFGVPPPLRNGFSHSPPYSPFHTNAHSCRSFVCPPAALIRGGRLDFVTERRERRLILSRPKKTHPDNGAPAGPSSSTRPPAAQHTRASLCVHIYQRYFFFSFLNTAPLGKPGDTAAWTQTTNIR